MSHKLAEKVARYGPEIWRMVEKSLVLQLLDQHWKEHLLALDHLRQGIGLRAFGQKDPLNEYKREAFNLFETMLGTLRETLTTALSHLELHIQEPEQVAQSAQARAAGQEMRARHPNPLTGEEEMANGELATLARPPSSRRAAATIDANNPATWGKVRRNAPCPCGSGKKYKYCCGAL